MSELYYKTAMELFGDLMPIEAIADVAELAHKCAENGSAQYGVRKQLLGDAVLSAVPEVGVFLQQLTERTKPLIAHATNPMAKKIQRLAAEGSLMQTEKPARNIGSLLMAAFAMRINSQATA